MHTTKKIIKFLFLITLTFTGTNYKTNAMQLSETIMCPTCSTDDIPKEAGKTLPCSHAFCTNCLVIRHAQATAQKQESLCPTCQLPMFVDNLEGQRLRMKLENNHSYRNALNNAQRLPTDTELPICVICSTDEAPKIAGKILYCAHPFCVLCLTKYFATCIIKNKTFSCPLCNALINNNLLETQLKCHQAHKPELILALLSHRKDQEKEDKDGEATMLECSLQEIRDILSNGLKQKIYDEKTLELIKSIALGKKETAKIGAHLRVFEHNELYYLWERSQSIEISAPARSDARRQRQ